GTILPRDDLYAAAVMDRRIQICRAAVYGQLRHGSHGANVSSASLDNAREMIAYAKIKKEGYRKHG
ncbi:MAG: hypothetical protein MR700_06625, partial [Selenomonadaceae bacterium]|nr:hypothetical protein [Selenomonadaceae bacterium]